MSPVFIEIPGEIIHATRMTPQELRRELVIHLFQQGKLSFGKARESSGMDIWAIQQLLGSRGIAVHYDIDDYRQDLQTLREHNTPAAIGAIGGVLVSPSHVGYNGVR